MSRADRTALALNLGSTSLKAVSYSFSGEESGGVAVVQETGRVSVEIASDGGTALEHDGQKWLDGAVGLLSDLQEPPDMVVHRIVHGGDRIAPALLTPATLAELLALAPLAPLHQPAALALAQAAIARWPAARQFGAFDTSWHHTMPEIHRLFALPYALYSSGVKRYGFHGLAFQSAVRQLSLIAPGLAKQRLVLAHLGGGSSLCAVLEGRSVSTTMGMTPLGGIAMGSRSGSLDPGVVLHLQRSLGLSADEIDRLLWRESGLKGLSGESGDMRALLASGSAGARRAIDHYVSGVVQGIAAMAACLKGIDALVLSGGIGVHSADIRARVTGELRWMGLDVDPVKNDAGAADISSTRASVRTFVLAVDEAKEMVESIATLGSHEIKSSG